MDKRFLRQTTGPGGSGGSRPGSAPGSPGVWVRSLLRRGQRQSAKRANRGPAAWQGEPAGAFVSFHCRPTHRLLQRNTTRATKRLFRPVSLPPLLICVAAGRGGGMVQNGRFHGTTMYHRFIVSVRFTRPSALGKRTFLPEGIGAKAVRKVRFSTPWDTPPPAGNELSGLPSGANATSLTE